MTFARQTRRCPACWPAPAWPPRLEADGPAEQVDGELVSGNYFEVLGVQPHLGRLFTDLDERADVNRVAVLSYGYWQRRFGGDPQ